MTALIILILLLCGFFTGILSYKSFSIKKTVISVYPILIMIIAAIYYQTHGFSITFWVGIVLNMIFLYFSFWNGINFKRKVIFHDCRLFIFGINTVGCCSYKTRLLWWRGYKNSGCFRMAFWFKKWCDGYDYWFNLFHNRHCCYIFCKAA